MHALAATALGMLAAAPALAQDMAVIEACATAEIGTESCDREKLADNLGLLDAGHVLEFHELGMESFAMLTALRFAASAMFFAEEGDGCFAEEERANAVDIWSTWVRMPEDPPEGIVRQFAVYDGVMARVIDMELDC